MKEEIIRQGNISLILDSYDDLFSDFDPRPYGEKALSEDFLRECRNATRDKNGDSIELRLLVPKAKRNHNHEETIKHRLKEHFTKHFSELSREASKLKKEGLVWFLAGISLIILAAVLAEQEGFLTTIFFVTFEPAGWFTAWTGLEKAFIETKKMPDLKFYQKMTKLNVEFHPY